MKSLFGSHKTDKLPPEQADMLADMKEQVEAFIDTRKTEEANKAKAIVLCKQLGQNASKLTVEEWRVPMKVLDSSTPVHRVRKRK